MASSSSDLNKLIADLEAKLSRQKEEDEKLTEKQQKAKLAFAAFEADASKLTRKIERNRGRKVPGYWKAPVHAKVHAVLKKEGFTPRDWEDTVAITEFMEQNHIPIRGPTLTRAQVESDIKALEALPADYVNKHPHEVELMRKLMEWKLKHSHPEGHEGSLEEAGPSK